MGVEDRRRLIEEIETSLDAKVLVVITGDRPRMETRIAPDLLPLVSEHLTRIGEARAIALFLYTPGGDTIAAWGVVGEAALTQFVCARS